MKNVTEKPSKNRCLYILQIVRATRPRTRTSRRGRRGGGGGRPRGRGSITGLLAGVPVGLTGCSSFFVGTERSARARARLPFFVTDVQKMSCTFSTNYQHVLSGSRKCYYQLSQHRSYEIHERHSAIFAGFPIRIRQISKKICSREKVMRWGKSLVCWRCPRMRRRSIY